jgi:hypothetical protein
MSTTSIQPQSTTGSSALPTVSLAAGVVAAALTTVLSFISLALGGVAIVTGLLAVRRGSSSRAVVGVTAAAVSIYVIVLEIMVLGG